MTFAVFKSAKCASIASLQKLTHKSSAVYTHTFNTDVLCAGDTCTVPLMSIVRMMKLCTCMHLVSNNFLNNNKQPQVMIDTSRFLHIQCTSTTSGFPYFVEVNKLKTVEYRDAKETRKG